MRLLAEYLSAGYPSAAEGYEDEPLDLHTYLVRHPNATFFYRVKGDELRNEFVRDGSVLIVDRSVSPSRGCLVVIEADGRFVVTRFDPNAAMVVCGVVVGVVLKL
jgi:DNA polymerase V